MRAKKSLGQNFLTSKTTAKDIIEAAGISMKDTVLEIGPGKGFLTEELLDKSDEVIVMPKDAQLVEYLKKKFEEEIHEEKLKIIHGDILTFNPIKHGIKDKGYIIVANIPYYITGQILRLFLGSDTQPSKMTLMVQKEVAKRIVARDGKESILSISVKIYGIPKYIKKVPAKYFKPQPKVDSAILLIDSISKNLFKDKESESNFFKVLKAGFAHKRKILINNLKKYGNTADVFDKCDIPPKTRAEELSVKDWLCISQKLK